MIALARQMNQYSTEFFATCPVNGVRVKYHYCIRTTKRIRVERILEEVSRLTSGFHEDFADHLSTVFDGDQTLRADHHGVSIETVRASKVVYLDEKVGGMAGTPGY